MDNWETVLRHGWVHEDTQHCDHGHPEPVLRHPDRPGETLVMTCTNRVVHEGGPHNRVWERRAAHEARLEEKEMARHMREVLGEWA